MDADGVNIVFLLNHSVVILTFAPFAPLAAEKVTAQTPMTNAFFTVRHDSPAEGALCTKPPIDSQPARDAFPPLMDNPNGDAWWPMFGAP